MKIIRKSIQKIIEIGVDKDLDQKTIERLKILNFTSFFLALNPLIALCVYDAKNSLTYILGIVFFTEAILFSLILLLQYLKKYELAKILLFILSIAIQFLHNNFLFEKQYTEYYYLTIPIAALLFFNNKYIHYFFLVLSLLLFYVPNYFLKIYEQEAFGFFHVIPFYIGIFIALSYFRSENLKNQKALKEHQRQLQLAYRELEASKKKELAHLQLQSLKSQMNPHFIFNALNSIQEYIVLNQKRLASDYLGKFSDLIRLYLNHSLQSYIALEEEIRGLNMYLELEKLRFEDKLSYAINYSEDIELDSILIPTMLLQPYVENALKHGLLHKTENGILTINFKINTTEKLIHCSVTDNGVGRDKANRIRLKRFPTHKSFASKATQDRLDLINLNLEESSKKAKVNIIDLFDNDMAVGTTVHITIPYKI